MKEQMIKVVGLTGGIASGKTAVADVMREQGLPVIDADALAHMVLEPDGGAYGPVVERFGTDILDENQKIDREKLGKKVFEDDAARRDLEAMTHPHIAMLARRGMELVAERGESVVIYEAALLVETGIYKGLDAVVVVSSSVAHQLERIVARDGLANEAAAQRIAAQYPLEEKLKVADFIITNDQDLEYLRTHTKQIVEQIKEKFGAADGK